MAKKVIFFVILTLMIVVGCSYLLKKNGQQKFTDNSDNQQEEWKTYLNSEWGFQLSYPGNWYYKQKKSSGTTPFAVLFSDINLDNYSPAPGRSYPDRFVNVVLYKTDKTVEEYIEEDSIEKNNQIKEKKEIIISGIRGMMTKTKFDNSMYLSAYISRNGYIYIFESTISNPQDITVVEESFSKIVSSFKFSN